METLQIFGQWEHTLDILPSQKWLVAALQVIKDSKISGYLCRHRNHQHFIAVRKAVEASVCVCIFEEQDTFFSI